MTARWILLTKDLDKQLQLNGGEDLEFQVRLSYYLSSHLKEIIEHMEERRWFQVILFLLIFISDIYLNSFPK